MRENMPKSCVRACKQLRNSDALDKNHTFEASTRPVIMPRSRQVPRREKMREKMPKSCVRACKPIRNAEFGMMISDALDKNHSFNASKRPAKVLRFPGVTVKGTIRINLHARTQDLSILP